MTIATMISHNGDSVSDAIANNGITPTPVPPSCLLVHFCEAGSCNSSPAPTID